MNYKHIYDSLIFKCKNREKPNTYTERHHIIPRCMQGNDTEDNLVFLTAKEHFVAHHLLCKIYSSNPKLWFAFNAMVHWRSKNTNGRVDVVKLTATQYEQLRIKRSENISKLVRGRFVSEETKEKIKIARAKQSFSDETRQKISNSLKKVKHTAEWNKKVSEGLKKYKCTPEHGRHISEAKKGKHIKYNMNSAKRFQNQYGINNMQAKKYYVDDVLIGCQQDAIPWILERLNVHIAPASKKCGKIKEFIKLHNYKITLDEIKEFVNKYLK